MLRKIFIIIAFLSISLLSLASFAHADYAGQQNNFFIDKNYDINGRDHLIATLLSVSSRIYFYVDASWWQNLDYASRDVFNRNLYYLFHRFEDQDYNVLTKTFGWAPDFPNNDTHITVLLHPMLENISGYVRSADIINPTQQSNSNNRIMVYLDTKTILAAPAEQAGYYLAHEFMHLITLNQKGTTANNDNDIWLNEARAEYASTLLGYDANYSGSNLEQRVNAFWQNPSVSLVNWQNDPYHYAVANLFAQYLVDNYGIKILVDSLHSKLSGIASLNEALQNGFSDNFNQIFQNWALTVLLNDCSIGPKYCYKNANLKNLRIFPYGYYLPDSGLSNLSVSNNLSAWTGNWLKIAGGQGVLKLDFSFPANSQFVLPYIIIDQNGNKTIKIWDSNFGYTGTIIIPSFNKNNVALFLVPILMNDPMVTNGESAMFKWTASTISEADSSAAEKAADQKMAIFLTNRINQLKAQLVSLMAQLVALKGGTVENLTCGSFNNDLYFGLANNNEVKCLQKFLASQGTDIYPNGLITGNYFQITQEAVRQYQLKNGVLASGYFGPLTRNLANKQLKP